MNAVLSRIIPPPVYISMPSIGVDISDTSLKYVGFAPSLRQDTERELQQWGEVPIPNGIVQRGQVQDAAKLAAVLNEFRAETKAEFIRVSLPEERAYLFETEIKQTVPLKEIRGLLEFKLEENVPISSKEVLFDYTILPTASETRTAQVAVAAYAKETIQRYYDVCMQAGLRPVAFEVEAQAMARAVVPRDASGVTMLVDFGKTRTGIGIVYKGVLLYTSTVDIGGDQLSQALRRVIGNDMAEAELTKLKNTQGLVRSIENPDVHDTLISTISVIKDEIATRMEYWHLRTGNNEIRRISSVVLCGGSSNLKGLPAYLTNSLGVPCVRGNVWENAFSLDDTVPPIDRQHSFGYATAIGLALKNTV